MPPCLDSGLYGPVPCRNAQEKDPGAMEFPSQMKWWNQDSIAPGKILGHDAR